MQVLVLEVVCVSDIDRPWLDMWPVFSLSSSGGHVETKTTTNEQGVGRSLPSSLAEDSTFCFNIELLRAFWYILPAMLRNF